MNSALRNELITAAAADVDGDRDPADLHRILADLLEEEGEPWLHEYLELRPVLNRPEVHDPKAGSWHWRSWHWRSRRSERCLWLYHVNRALLDRLPGLPPPGVLIGPPQVDTITPEYAQATTPNAASVWGADPLGTWVTLSSFTGVSTLKTLVHLEMCSIFNCLTDEDQHLIEDHGYWMHDSYYLELLRKHLGSRWVVGCTLRDALLMKPFRIPQHDIRFSVHGLAERVLGKPVSQEVYRADH